MSEVSNEEKISYVKSSVRSIPNFPKAPINFRDISTLMKDAKAYRYTMELLFDRYKDMQVDYFIGLEARGFLFASTLAFMCNCGCILIRKKGKLPVGKDSEGNEVKVVDTSFSKEYEAVDYMEMHADAVSKGDRVVIIDDLIATGGTLQGACKLCDALGANVLECGCVINLPELKGNLKIKGYKLFTLIDFEGE